MPLFRSQKNPILYPPRLERLLAEGSKRHEAREKAAREARLISGKGRYVKLGLQALEASPFLEIARGTPRRILV